MNIAAAKLALTIPARSSLFHSTAVLSRRRRNRHSDNIWREQNECDENDTSWFRFREQYSANNFQRNGASKKGSRDRDKNGGDEFDYTISSDNEYNPSSSRGPSWFKKAYSKREQSGNSRARGQERHWKKRGFQFCNGDEDIDMETIFRSAFTRRNKGAFYWSFTSGENPQWWGQSGKSGSSWHWRNRFEKENESDGESSDSDLAWAASDRIALGLSSSGPIKLQDVKTAYRSCALKWHPDRHQGSSKAVAEEKFKVCSAAYQSLCDKLAA